MQDCLVLVEFYIISFDPQSCLWSGLLFAWDTWATSSENPAVPRAPVPLNRQCLCPSYPRTPLCLRASEVCASELSLCPSRLSSWASWLSLWDPHPVHRQQSLSLHSLIYSRGGAPIFSLPTPGHGVKPGDGVCPTQSQLSEWPSEAPLLWPKDDILPLSIARLGVREKYSRDSHSAANCIQRKHLWTLDQFHRASAISLTRPHVGNHILSTSCFILR